MQISIFVPQYGTIEGITPAYRSFQMANEIRSTFDKPPIFNIEYVGLNKYVPANNGEYTIKTDRLLKDVTYTDLLIIPPIYGKISNGVQMNAEAIPYIKNLYHQGSSLASLCVGAFLLAETGLFTGKKCSTHWAHINEFKERYPDVTVEDGAIITEHDNIYSSGGGRRVWNLIL